jgi:hypothetical protein
MGWNQTNMLTFFVPFFILLALIVPGLAAYAYHRSALKKYPNDKPVPRYLSNRLWDSGFTLYVVIAIVAGILISDDLLRSRVQKAWIQILAK